MSGKVKNLSLGGTGLEVFSKNPFNSTLKPGMQLNLCIVLPNGSKVEAIAKVQSVNKGSTPDMLLIGMSFAEMTNETKKTLGFFMMG